MKQKYIFDFGKNKIKFDSLEEFCEAVISYNILGSVYCNIVDYYVDKSGIEIIEKISKVIINISTYYLSKLIGKDKLKSFTII